MATPQAGRGFFGLMTLLGTYVGIVPMLRRVGGGAVRARQIFLPVRAADRCTLDPLALAGGLLIIMYSTGLLVPA